MKEKLRQWLMALSVLARPLAELTATKYDDKVLDAFTKLAMNDGALNYLDDLIQLFANKETVTDADLKKVALKHAEK